MSDDRIATFVNVFDFSINMRAGWLDNNPSIIITGKGTITGPVSYLSEFGFLQEIRTNMEQVESSTLDDTSATEYDDFDPNNGYDTDNTILTEEDFEKYGIDIHNINWVKVKFVDLLGLCNDADIDISHINMESKSKAKWDLVKIIKQYINN